MATILFVWLICGVLTFGITLAYFTREYPGLTDRGDVVFALCLSVIGPLGLLVSVLMSGGVKHGLCFKRDEKQTTHDKN